MFDARYLTGTIYLDHQLIGNIWVPVGFHGKTAIEVAGGSLVGLSIKLKGANFKLNPKLSDKLFDPGF